MSIVGFAQETRWGRGEKHGWLRLRRVASFIGDAMELNVRCWTRVNEQNGWRVAAMCMVYSLQGSLAVELSIGSPPPDAIGEEIVEESHSRARHLKLELRDNSRLRTLLSHSYTWLTTLEVLEGGYSRDGLRVEERLGVWDRLEELVSLKLRRVEIPWGWMQYCQRLTCLHLCWETGGWPGGGEEVVKDVMSAATLGALLQALPSLEEWTFSAGVYGRWEGPRISMGALRRLSLTAGGHTLREIMATAAFPAAWSIDFDLTDGAHSGEVLERIGKMVSGRDFEVSRVRMGGLWAFEGVEVRVDYEAKGVCRVARRLPARDLLDAASEIVEVLGVAEVVSLSCSRLSNDPGVIDGDWDRFFRATQRLDWARIPVDGEAKGWEKMTEELQRRKVGQVDGVWSELRTLTIEGSAGAQLLLDWCAFLSIGDDAEDYEETHSKNISAWKAEAEMWRSGDWGSNGHALQWRSGTFHRDSISDPWEVVDD